MAELAQQRYQNFENWTPADFMEFVQEVLPEPEHQASVDIIRNLGFDGDIMTQIVRDSDCLIPIPRDHYWILKRAAQLIVDRYTMRQLLRNKIYERQLNEENLQHPMSWNDRNRQRAADQQDIEEEVEEIMAHYEQNYEEMKLHWLRTLRSVRCYLEEDEAMMFPRNFRWCAIVRASQQVPRRVPRRAADLQELVPQALLDGGMWNEVVLLDDDREERSRRRQILAQRSAQERELQARLRPIIRAPPEQVEQFAEARNRMMEQARERARVRRRQQNRDAQELALEAQ